MQKSLTIKIRGTLKVALFIESNAECESTRKYLERKWTERLIADHWPCGPAAPDVDKIDSARLPHWSRGRVTW